VNRWTALQQPLKQGPSPPCQLCRLRIEPLQERRVNNNLKPQATKYIPYTEHHPSPACSPRTAPAFCVAHSATSSVASLRNSISLNKSDRAGEPPTFLGELRFQVFDLVIQAIGTEERHLGVSSCPWRFVPVRPADLSVGFRVDRCLEV
jgi:hypothetical protein